MILKYLMVIRSFQMGNLILRRIQTVIQRQLSCHPAIYTSVFLYFTQTLWPMLLWDRPSVFDRLSRMPLLHCEVVQSVAPRKYAVEIDRRWGSLDIFSDRKCSDCVGLRYLSHSCFLLMNVRSSKETIYSKLSSVIQYKHPLSISFETNVSLPQQ